jgi:O-antigen/teichoic acid export membrane protein
MRHFLRIFPLALILLGAVLLFERPAYAYADPGTGLLAVQAAGSALVAAGWYLRRKIYLLFHRGSKIRGSDAPGPAGSEDSPQP